MEYSSNLSSQYSRVASMTSRCNNCGKKGHVFSMCRLPITSLGVICFRKHESNIEVLMIRRKDSLGFVDFMRGRYDLYQKNHVLHLIDEMTIAEKELLCTKSFEELWEHLWGSSKLSKKYMKEKEQSLALFTSLKNGIHKDSDYYTLESIVGESTTTWNEPEWGFPKGRRNNNEKDLQSALREFEEETGIHSDNIMLLQNLLPLEEIFTGSNFKSYDHKYYVAQMKSHVVLDMDKYQKSEVSSIDWFSLGDAISKLRPYNFERKLIIHHLKKILETYSLI